MFGATSYFSAPFAIEYRNRLDDPPGAWMERLQQAGVRATWISVVSPHGEPWYPSRILPMAPEAPADHCRRLVEEAHRRGITVVSWWPMNHNKAALALHPDWAISPLPDPERSGGRPDYPTAIYPCPTSPYRAMLNELVAEAIDLTGVDGYFFDGATFGYNGGPFQMACCCGRCAERFHAETGNTMPARVDFDDPAFRRFIRWEYDLWKGYVRDLANAIHAARPGAYVGLNVFNRPPDLDFRGGTPLEELTGCAVTLCAELGWTPNHPYEASAMLCKVFRAMQAGRAGGAELYAGSPVWLDIWDEHAMSHLIANGLSAIAQNCCLSYGADRPITEYGDAAPKLTRALAGPREHAGGAPVSYIGLHLSGQTKDFHYRLQHMRYWDHVRGVHELLSEAHLPFDYVLDDQIRPDVLARYAILLMPESMCLSTAQMQAVRAYVENGGILVAGGAVAMADEWGEPWLDAQSGLKDLLGLGAHAPIDSRSAPVVVERRYGKGIAAHMAINLGEAYMVYPEEGLARFVADWLKRLSPPPITLDGPWCVSMEAYELADGAGEMRVHLDNHRSRPHRSWRNAPSSDVEAALCGRGPLPRAARFMLSGTSLECRAQADQQGDYWTIQLPPLPRYEIVQVLR